MPRRSRIMIIDQNADDIRLLTAAFERARWMVEAVIVNEGQLALAALQRNHDCSKPTDLVMVSSIPDGESCLQTLRSIKSHPDFRYLPVIVFSSARPPRDLAHACSLLGALKFIQIPGDLPHWILLQMRVTERFPWEGQRSAIPENPGHYADINSGRRLIV
jgi:CheY-like chemotaxis protein